MRRWTRCSTDRHRFHVEFDAIRQNAGGVRRARHSMTRDWTMRQVRHSVGAMSRRIHITGGSGSGTTTLGAHLAIALGIAHHDTDEFYWQPTDPGYTEKRPVPERLALMERMFLARPDWVLSGSLTGWGDPLIPRFDLVVRLTLSPETRLARLIARERLRNGEAIAPGGPREGSHRDFVRWARRYDDADFAGRSLRRHTEWCAALPCPVLVLDSAAAPGALVAQVRAALG